MGTNFEKAVQERAEDAAYTFAIVLKENGKVIGQMEAHPESSQPDLSENYVKDTFSPCWMLNKDYQGKGYAYEAAKAFFDYLFCQKGARRIYAYTEDYNLSSQHLCEKLGMRQEGLFREFVSFIGARLATGAIEWIGVPYFSNHGLTHPLFGVKGLLAKIVVSIVVIILNYIFSKFLVFIKKDKQAE